MLLGDAPYQVESGNGNEVPGNADKDGSAQNVAGIIFDGCCLVNVQRVAVVKRGKW